MVDIGVDTVALAILALADSAMGTEAIHSGGVSEDSAGRTMAGLVD